MEAVFYDSQLLPVTLFELAWQKQFIFQPLTIMARILYKKLTRLQIEYDTAIHIDL